MQIPHIRAHMAMMTTLVEQWRSDTATFHLLKGEITVMGEEVYHILRLLIRSVRVIAKRAPLEDVIQRLVGARVELCHRERSLDQALAQAPKDKHIYFYVCALVSEFILLYGGERLVVLGMIQVVIDAGRPMA